MDVANFLGWGDPKLEVPCFCNSFLPQFIKCCFLKEATEITASKIHSVVSTWYWNILKSETCFYRESYSCLHIISPKISLKITFNVSFFQLGSPPSVLWNTNWGFSVPVVAIEKSGLKQEKLSRARGEDWLLNMILNSSI